jgi:hypothetical protein
MRWPKSADGVAPSFYIVLAPTLLLIQHLVVALAFLAAGVPLIADGKFWLLPLRRLAELPQLSPTQAAVAFALSLTFTGIVALLSFKRAARSGYGYMLAALTILPAVQFVAVALLALTPPRRIEAERDVRQGTNIAHILQGILAGVAIIVIAVLISALSFGAYGWGLFVMTPFLVGVTTAYIANRETALPDGRTWRLVLMAAALGTIALVMLALEGLICILLASPLGVVAALAGGGIGRAAALADHRRGKPLLSIALLPAIFLIEGAVPPAVPIEVQESVSIAASPQAVWAALTSSAPIGPPPPLIAWADFAYPIRGRLLGIGLGAERLGIFSTGTAHERITAWEPGRRLAFKVVSQPPMMKEMSPYRRVHAPHLTGYFETSTTRFDLTPLPRGGTRLTAFTAHMLRIDPAPYWEPMARWAIHENVRRVLESMKARAEANAGRPVVQRR